MRLSQATEVINKRLKPTVHDFRLLYTHLNESEADQLRCDNRFHGSTTQKELSVEVRRDILGWET